MDYSDEINRAEQIQSNYNSCCPGLLFILLGVGGLFIVSFGSHNDTNPV